MAKYSYEFKKEVVTAYLDGLGGYEFLAAQYGIPAWSNIKKWVLGYQKFGDEALFCSRKYIKYSFEYKLHVVELYLSTEVSYQELALQEGIPNPAQICKWVNAFNAAGPDALRPRKKGRKKSLSSKNNIKKATSKETLSVDASAEHIKQLEEELFKLRIENAFLKELRRLRLEDEEKMKGLQGSSAVSEDSLN